MLLGNHLEYLYIFFNSPLFRFCFTNNFAPLGDEGRELRKVFFDKIPILEIDNKTNNKFKELLDNPAIINSEEINQLIYRLYDLQEREIKIVEKDGCDL